MRTLSASDIAHCAIGVDGAVLDPGMTCDRYWPESAFVDRYPTLAAIVILEVNPLPDLDERPQQGPRRPWRTIIRWLSRGATPANDCVTVVVYHLARAGVVVPRYVTTPRALYRFLQGDRHARRTIRLAGRQ